MSDATTIRLWEGKAPLAAGDEPADVPKIDIYRPDKDADGSAIVVCPGGGYGHLAPHESEPIARWLNTLGVTGIVLTYRIAPRYHYPAAFMDVSRAIRTVRHRAKEFELDPQRIGVLGFSAGGHLSANISTRFDNDDRAADEINNETARPDVSVLLYPVVTLDGPSAHLGSRRNLLGEKPPQEMIDMLSCEKQVTAHTPPAFIFHTVGDAGVPVENAMLYAAAMRKAGVAFEMHLFERGRHGVGLASDDPVLGKWPMLCANWLKLRKFGKGA